jgi:DNA-binding response OmpR family regulator
MRLLVVEDDVRVAAALCSVLRRHGFEVEPARTAGEALERLESDPDVILLDLGLPDRDGFELCGRIRAVRDVPIIMVTARGDVRSRIHGLHLGADDYVVKPYDVGELIARIHVVSRRTARRDGARPAEQPAEPAAGTLIAGRIHLDRLRRVVSVDGVPATLTRKEFDLLAVLARRPGVVCPREQLISEVWRTNWQGNQRTLEVHVASLRAKLRVPGAIQTVRGVGYRVTPDGGPPAESSPATDPTAGAPQTTGPSTGSPQANDPSAEGPRSTPPLP